MIPKKIHYCWFGKNKLPDKAVKCINSWKKYCPDYEIIEWNEDNFDVRQNGYTEFTYDNRKFAFLSDYARLQIILQEVLHERSTQACLKRAQQQEYSHVCNRYGRAY